MIDSTVKDIVCVLVVSFNVIVKVLSFLFNDQLSILSAGIPETGVQLLETLSDASSEKS